jgi:ketosteroid isomerase-like protein
MIRPALLLASLDFTIPAHAQTVAGTPADEQLIRELIAQHASSAQRDDVDGMVATQHDDVDERLNDGRILVGKSEVAKFFRSIVARGPHRLAHVHPTDSIRIRSES